MSSAQPFRWTRFGSMRRYKNRRRRWWLYRKGTIWHASRIGKTVGI